MVFNNSTGRTGDTGRDAGRTRGRTDTRTHGRTDTAHRPHHHGAAARGDERGEATYTTEGTEGFFFGFWGRSPPRAGSVKTFVFSSRRVHVPIVFGVCSLVSPLVDATPYPLTFISRMLCGSCVLHRSIPFFVRCSSEFGAKRWVY